MTRIMKYLSIIIPSYNMEMFLPRAIDSIINCKHLHDIEVVVINDGSNDSTSMIGHKYADRYVGDVFIIDKSNGNYGSCINEGLKHITGKYVKVLDADDYLDTTNLDLVIDALLNTDVDMLVTPFCKVDNDNKKYMLRHITLSPYRDYSIDKLEKSKDILGIWMHEIIYKRRMLLEMNYLQTPGISYTDMEWVFIPLLRVKTVRYLPYVLYYYQTGRIGQTVDPSIHRKKYNDEITVTLSMAKALSKNRDCQTSAKAYNLLLRKIMKRQKTIYRQVLVAYQEYDNKELRSLTYWIKENNPDLFLHLMNMKLSVPLFPFPFVKWWYVGNKNRRFHYMVNLFRRYKHIT